MGSQALNGAGVVYDGLLALGHGAVLAGMVLGAIAAFVIDRKFLWAASYAAFGAVLASVGLIHGAKVELFADLKIALGYLLFAGVFAAAHFLGAEERAVDQTDPVDIEMAAVPPAADVIAHEPPAPGRTVSPA